MKPSNLEISLLRELLESYPLVNRNVEIQPLENIGYVIDLGAGTSTYSDWVFYDLDDTIVASWQAKDKRLEKYLSYLRSLQIIFSDDFLLKMFALTDECARWTEVNKSIYHFHTHIALLAVTIDILEAHKENDESIVYDAVVELLRSFPKETSPNVPQDRLKLLEKTIFSGVITPHVYTDAVNSMKLLQEDEIGIGIFTYGEPYFQLLKSLELLQNSYEEQRFVSQIWLTKVPKGRFLKKAATTLRGSLLVIDDSPAELDDIHVNFHNQKARLHLVRSIRDGTKTVDHSWDLLHDNHTSFDARPQSSNEDLLSHIRRALSSLN